MPRPSLFLDILYVNQGSGLKNTTGTAANEITPSLSRATSAGKTGQS